MAKRKVYHVTHDKDDSMWKVKAQGGERASSVHATKDEAVDAGRTLAKNNMPSQLIVHLMNGQIETEYTYGDDPVSSPG